ncbi:MAG: hypothetical protein KJ905_00110 [Nanoarchaeota archaeon]|nr:hypothetical protein [Nanoarchaeota archaeon]MBU2458844.1 hypothetical protein [Nanoarchaeota archaeon]
MTDEKINKIDQKKNEVVEETKKKIEEVVKEVTKVPEKSEKPKEEKIKEKKTEEKPKKTGASVSVRNIPMSTKHSIALCDFVRKKKIVDAIKDIEMVLAMKKAVPMKGEIPHRKGKGMMSGRFPQNASENFVKILKSLAANAMHNGLEEPIIVEAVSNIGERPYGKFGRVRKSRTHVLIKAKEEKR